MTKQTVFADRVLSLSVAGATVRMDLGILESARKDDKPAVKATATHQLIMPLEGFVEAVRAQQKLLQQIAAQNEKRRAAKTPTASEEKKGG